MASRLPVAFIPHGGGPWPLMPIAKDPAHVALSEYLRVLAKRVGQVRAVVIISAHWEAPQPTVIRTTKPSLYYDYSGFPPPTYAIEWLPETAPDVAEEIALALADAGITAASEAKRGLDHGVFVPGMVAWPNADVPVVQLSLVRGLDPATHLALGRALAPLREKGIFLLGSGMSYHNLREWFRGQRQTVRAVSQRFDAWLRAAVTAPQAQRDTALLNWLSAPGARAAHPREEHLLPLHVIAGAAGTDMGHIPFGTLMMGAHVSAVEFG